MHIHSACATAVDLSKLGAGVRNIDCPTTGTKLLARSKGCDVMCLPGYVKQAGSTTHYACSADGDFTAATLKCNSGMIYTQTATVVDGLLYFQTRLSMGFAESEFSVFRFTVRMAVASLLLVEC